MIRQKIFAQIVMGVALVVLVTPTTEAQWITHPPAADSPHWWTLTDEVTPVELRTALQSRQASRERLKAAIQAGQHPELPPREWARVSFFLDGEMTPELVPMFDAFSILATWINRDITRTELKIRQDLASTGVSAEGTDLIFQAAKEYRTRAQEIISEVDYEQRRFAARVLAPTRERLGNERAAEVLRRKEFDKLAQESDLPEAEVAALYKEWRRDPWVEAAVAEMVDLREALQKDDWQNLRRYMLENVANQIHFDHYAEGAYR